MKPPLTLTARSPEDLLAAVPCILGFRPEDSLVLLTFGGPGAAFHARVDLPHDPADVAEVSDVLRQALRRNGVSRAALVSYSTDAAGSAAALTTVVGDLLADRVDVVEVLRAEPDRWFRAWPGQPEAPADGVAFDAGAHPFVATAVFGGTVVLGSRAELAATIETDPGAVSLVVGALRTARARVAFVQPAAEEPWVRSVVARHVDRREPLAVDELARLLLALRDLGLRDCAWSTITRANASAQVDFWRDAVRRSPDELVAPAAALLAFAAWQAGQGALAWCALDRCEEADPGYSMAGLVGELLAGAVPPDTWEPFSAALGPAPGHSGARGPGGSAA